MESELPAGELDCEVCPWVVLQSLFVAEIVNPWHLMFVHTQVTCAESKTFASPEIKVVCLLSSAPIFGIPWETTRIPFRSLLQTRRLGQAHVRPGTWPDWHFSEPQSFKFLDPFPGRNYCWCFRDPAFTNWHKSTKKDQSTHSKNNNWIPRAQANQSWWIIFLEFHISIPICLVSFPQGNVLPCLLFFTWKGWHEKNNVAHRIYGTGIFTYI